MAYFRRPSPEAQAHLKQIGDQVIRVGNEAVARAAALYYRPSHGKLVFLASSILLGVGTTRFLVTAAHVVDEFLGKAFYAGGKHGIVQLAGTWVLTRIPHGGRKQDHIDVALLRLSEKAAQQLDLDCIFPEETEPAFQPDPRRVIGTHYICVGFPQGLQSTWMEGGALTRPKHRYWHLKPGAAPETLGAPYNRIDNLVLSFDKVGVKDDGEMFTAPDPVGMSGCGVWACNGLAGLSLHSARLVGVCTTWLPERDAIIATRIGHHLNVAEHFDKLAHNAADKPD
jgi:hypothetical protein